ncbi:MAG: hypothetical protein A2086_14225 [Spirochaetes bacterium GWD1_27_9]|nr:MAG: hypothetical protein A2Z98_09295 [Spirochaetes bacterium GWB1_27_13]OHD23676.1 MAG: hypothetical protein A2Y34_15435 [Spirochaetes bacterium GWC1_27_15]OHD29881.1 MAG: hypothetical protein A2086_14225 [Spirochaetes bacterium GWD1_27_9]
MKVLILNLPLPEFYQKYQKGNHQLFAEYIESLILTQQIKDIQIIKLSRDIIDRLNNRSIISEIMSYKPDIVCFSSYLWNIDRNIQIASVLKTFGITTITGGPEIQFDNKELLDNRSFDIFVVGEGENIFLQILIKAKNNIESLKEQRVFVNNCPINFNDFIVEYSTLSNQYSFDKLAYIEIERGCPFKCKFCAYGKSRTAITEIDFDKFTKVFDTFLTKNVTEFYLLSPTLNRNKANFRKYLEYIKKTKNNELKIFGELRIELLDDFDINLLKESGFNCIEFGVQTLKEENLTNLNRKSKNSSFKEFSYKLLEAGITPIIDFIVGFPDESYLDLTKTIDYLDEANLLNYCNFYHLQLLHSTDLKEEFINNNYIFQKKSPYFAIKTNKMNFNDIKNVYLYLDKEKDFSYIEEFYFENKEEFYIIKNNDDLQILLETPYYKSCSLILIDNFSYQEILTFFNQFFIKNPEIFHISYIYSTKKIDFSFLQSLNDIFASYKNFYDLYRESINYFSSFSFSKVLNILVKPNIPKKYFETLLDNYSIDFVFFSNEKEIFKKQINLLQKFFDEEEINTFIFAGFEEFDYKFLKRFPEVECLNTR